jgi:GT2 family glycosyltransferase
MRLSVIIVSYNVRHFLEQALWSVRRALEGIGGEVWVVDNHSTDDSVAMVREKFPEVRLIANEHNPGFAIANNQAIRASSGEYVLLLNPDTIVEENTFRQCLAFMDAHPDAGALGPWMMDGSGKYLPESKRGFPSPWVAFCKTVGLSALFPKSRLFNQYYLGQLSARDTHSVEVLAGCFMFMRRAALDRAGLLDEAFFMYGEDIDLSYRIIQAGYKNYYFPEARIVHYKGESTKKGSLNYVKAFYQAMIIFTRKHFSGGKAGLFVFMLKIAIYLRAAMALARNAWSRWWLPLLDAVLIYGGLLVLKNFWANYYYKDPTWFKTNVLWFNFPLYILIWLGTVWLSGGYDHRYRLRQLVGGLGLGTLVLAAVYGFLDLDYRPSRALVLMGAVWAVLFTGGLRALMHFIEFGNVNVGQNRVKNIATVGLLSDGERVQTLLQQAGVPHHFIGHIRPEAPADRSYLGALTQLEALARIYRLDEIIFCSGSVPYTEVLHWMQHLGPALSYKIVPPGSNSIIGSSNKNEPGELYTVDVRFGITRPGQRRNKRVFDVALCLALLGALPLWLLLSPRRLALARYWWPVFIGRRHWVGYAPGGSVQGLPRLKPGVFSVADRVGRLPLDGPTLDRLNFLYAKDWEVWKDVEAMG